MISRLDAVRVQQGISREATSLDLDYTFHHHHQLAFHHNLHLTLHYEFWFQRWRLSGDGQIGKDGLVQSRKVTSLHQRCSK